MDNGDQFPRLASVYRKGSISGQHVKQSSRNVATITSDSAQYGQIAAETQGSHISTPNAWRPWNLMHKLAMQSNNANFRTVPNAEFKNSSSCGNEFSSRLNHYIEQGRSRGTFQFGSTQLNAQGERKPKNIELSNYGVLDDEDDKNGISDNDYYDDDEEIFGSSDDDDLLHHDYELDTSEKNHEMWKKSKWCKAFFNSLDALTAEELNSPRRKWHCPACKGGPGAIAWYPGLDPLMIHAKTIKTRRAKLHRVFADLLEEETRRRGVAVAPIDGAFGKWEGLNGEVKDCQIVWPPMVVIMNTRHQLEDNGKWIGMGNQELLDHFESYAAVKARHSYGPQGHKGISMLIFEGSTAGYLEAARLHAHFKEKGRGRDAWKNSRVLLSSGKRQLYGYMASKEDLDIFNQHAQGKSKLKFEMRSYRDNVDLQIKQINDSLQEVAFLKVQKSKEEKKCQVLTESLSRVTEMLNKSEKEKCDMRQLTKSMHDENKEELDSQEEFYKGQIDFMHECEDAKDENLDKLLQPKQGIVDLSNANLSTMKDSIRMEEFQSERKKLIQSHEDRKALIIQRYRQEMLELEKKLENELTQLVDKYTKDHTEIEAESEHACTERGRRKHILFKEKSRKYETTKN